MANSSIRSIFYAGTKTIAASSTPEPLVTDPVLVDSVRIDPSLDNSGTITLGFTDYISSTVVYVIGVPHVMTAIPGKKIDLSQIMVQASENGDGVSYLAIN